MTKRYSQMWQRYFTKMLFGEPLVIEIDTGPSEKSKKREQDVVARDFIVGLLAAWSQPYVTIGGSRWR